LNWGRGGNLEGVGNGEGTEGGGQFTSNLGPRWTRIAPHKEEGFQVSRRTQGKGVLSRGIRKGNWQGGINKGLRHGLVSSTCIYVS
jgi:hypothetical protein